MLLTADIGNTSITLGLFDDAALVEDFRLASDKDLSGEEYEVLLKSLFKNYKIDGCIISSVVERSDIFCFLTYLWTQIIRFNIE